MRHVLDTAAEIFAGGKHYLAKRIVALMPRHLHYVEPYGGGLSVLLERDPNDESLWLPPHKGVSEVANDIWGELINFWRVLRDAFPEFLTLCQVTPLARSVFGQACEYEFNKDNLIRSAWAFFVRARQSRAGSFEGFTQLTRSRLRRGINGNASEWLGAVDGLPAVHARLQPVVIECMDALDLIKREDGPGTLFYCDPCYYFDDRPNNIYEHGMTREQHENLLSLLSLCNGKVMLSGYHSKLYDEMLEGWRLVEFDLANHMSSKKSKKRMTECLWMNYDA